MLQIDNVQQIGDLTVYGDDQNDFTFYVLPQSPRFRQTDDGNLSFKFLKYRELREEGKDLFGGICSFDIEFVVPVDKVNATAAKLQEQVTARRRPGSQAPKVVIGPLTYTHGTAALLMGEGNVLVDKIRGAGKPSLYGNNVTTFWVELTKEGAAVFESALQGQGGFVSVALSLGIYAKLPPITARAWWHASQFYSFFQQVDTEHHFWSEDSYRETLNELMVKNEVMGTEFNFVGNPTMPAEDQRKVQEQIRSNILGQLQSAVERNLLKEIQKTDPDVKDLQKQGYDHIKKSVNKTQIADVNISYKENQVVEWTLNPQGVLPNITSMKGPDGKPYLWKDYAVDIDADAAFFQELDVTVQVNADFAQLPIFNVEVTLTYPSEPVPTTKSFTFSKPDDVHKFRAFIADKNRKYHYSYKVNYKGSSQPMVNGPFESEDTSLTIDVNDLGILVADITPGDLNFAQVKQAQVKVRYQDSGVKPIERQFTLATDKSTFQIREVIQKPRTQPIKFAVKYFMADGREYEVAEKEQDAPQIYINDPFSAMKTAGLRAVGDLNAKIQSITVDLTYRDAAHHNYTQTKTLALSKAMPFFDWTFPVIDENAGVLTYSGTIQYADGTTKDIPETSATRSTIQVGDIVADRLAVTIVPDLLDFSLVRLAKVTMKYSADTAVPSKDFVFKKGDETKNWVVELRDKTKRDYKWSAEFFLTDGTKKKLADQTGDGDTVILELPA